MQLLIFFFAVTAMSANTTLANDLLPTPVSNYLKRQGPIEEQESFLTSNQTLLAQYFCVDENLPGGKNEGANNPANVHCGVALFYKNAGSWTLSDEINLGQGAVKTFSANQLIAETVEYDLSKDALCCPSIRKEKIFFIRNGKFFDPSNDPILK